MTGAAIVLRPAFRTGSGPVRDNGPPADWRSLMRVLVVDDEQRLARSLKVGLEAEGFAVDVAHDGTDSTLR